jgi:hypothetical protein
MLNPTQILEKLEKLRRLDSKHKIFGASSHDYRLNPCLREAAINSVEDKYNIHLPEDYRRFLLEVGNGGAGPCYGVFRLGEHDDGWGFHPWEGGFLVGDPSAPFPYQDNWNLPGTFWSAAPHNKEWASEEEADEAYESWDAKLVEVYWTPSIMNGAIPICHCGCALRQWLIVTGPERGNIWQDDRADLNGVFPLQTKDGDRVSFSSWYVTWLEDSIHSLEG